MNQAVFNQKVLKKGFVLASIFLSIFFLPTVSRAATILQDDFTGTIIDTSKWTEFDTLGLGGTVGNLQQNDTLQIQDSATGGYGASALASKVNISPTNLEISSVISNVSFTSSPIMGYGDRDYASPGKKAYFMFVYHSGVLGISFNNGVGQNTGSACGAFTNGATYKLKVISTGFQLYKNNVLICTHTPGLSNLVSGKPVFLESEVASSSFDDLLVTGDGTLSVPDVPTGLSLTARTTEIRVAWVAPVVQGLYDITDYIIEYKLSSDSVWTTLNDGVSTTTSTSITGLTNDLAYDVRVTAVNAVGNSTAVSSSATPSIGTVPNAPTTLTATALNQELRVAWVAPAVDGGSSLTDYIIEYKLSSDSVWTTLNDGVSTTTSTSITGLTNDLSYNVRISAVNAVGAGTPSSTLTATPVLVVVLLSDSFTGTTIDTTKWNEIDGATGGTEGDVQQNGALTIVNSATPTVGSKALVSKTDFKTDNLEVSAVVTSSTSPMIGYGDRVYGGAGNKAYLIYAFGGNVLGLVWNNGVLRTNVACGSLVSGATYRMKVTSTGFQVYRNNTLACTVTPNIAYVVDNKPIFFEGDTAIASSFDDVLIIGKPLTPISPTSVTAVAGDTSATVSFSYSNINTTSQVTSYTVTSSPGGITATGVTSPIVVTGLTNGTPYTFTVTATTVPVGTSAASSPSSSVTPALPAAPDQVTGVTGIAVNRQVIIGWNAPSGAITDYIIEYKLSSDSVWTTFADGVSLAVKTVVTGLTNNAAYDFRVSAVNNGGTGASSTPISATPSAITALSFVITGESNAGGQVFNTAPTSEELAPTSEVQILNNTSLVFEDLDIGTNNNIDHFGLTCCTTHGFELELANRTKEYAFTDLPMVYLLKTGHGGSRLSQWDVGQSYWTKFLERTAAAKTQLPSPRQWVVWMSLGINDFYASTSTASFKSAMLSHINKIKADLPGAIVIMTQFQSMTANGGYVSYNQAMAELAASEEGVYVVDSTGAALDDMNHWSYTGLKTVADRMITITNTAIGLIYPGVPTSVSGMSGDEQVSLSWTAPTSDGGSAITDYIIEYKLSSDSVWTTFADGTSSATTASITGLTNDVQYDLRVSAVNSSGTGDASSVTTATPAFIATTYTVSGPSTGVVNATSSSFTVTPNGPYDGTITITPDGGGVSTPIVLTFTDATPQTFTVTPTAVGTVTLTSTNSGALVDPSVLMYEVTALPTPPVTRTVVSSGSIAIVPRPATCTIGQLFNTNTGNPCTSTTSSLPSVYDFTRNLSYRISGDDVRQLQVYLNTHGHPVALSGVGSRGYETSYFGPATRAALIKFQIANNIKPAIGFFGPLTRSFVGAHR